jgi:hypothetical protein
MSIPLGSCRHAMKNLEKTKCSPSIKHEMAYITKDLLLRRFGYCCILDTDFLYKMKLKRSAKEIVRKGITIAKKPNGIYSF